MEGETTRGRNDSGRNDSGRTGKWAKRPVTMTCTPREDSDQTAYSQSFVSRLYESLLDPLWVDKDQKFKRTAKTLVRNVRMCELI